MFWTQEVSSPETDHSRSTQPYESSYFLPGKIVGKAANFLLDTGCTADLLSRRLFDILGIQKRMGLVSYEGTYGTLSDRACIPMYAIITLPGRVYNQLIHEIFIVGHLEKQQCRMDFQKSAVVMAGKELVSVSKFGRPLVGGI